MKAVITGESKRVGIKVQDNNSVDHGIEMDFDGEIKYHEQDGYPDRDAKRTDDERIALKQARQFARYYVYRHRSYETLPPIDNPDRIAAGILALSRLQPSEFVDTFNELYAQLRSEQTDSDPPVDLPTHANTSNVVYEQDFYLTPSIETTKGLAAGLVTPTASEWLYGNSPPPSEKTDNSTEFGLRSDDPAQSDSASWIEVVSRLRVKWDNRAAGAYQTVTDHEPPRERDPDTRIEILPFTPESATAFQHQCLRTLLCQCRDCYIGMGVSPPEQFQIQGYGKHANATWYENLDVYQRYHDPQANIDWGRV